MTARRFFPAALAFAVVVVALTSMVTGGTSSLAGGQPHARLIDAQYGHTCAAMDSGPVQCWGLGDNGKLGDGHKENRNSPVLVVNGSTDVIDLALGDIHSCALDAGGAVQCWGYNGDGELGDGSDLDSLTPVDVEGLQSGVIDIDGQELSSCAVLATGGVKCWGINYSGNLGDGTLMDRHSPVDVMNLNDAVRVVGGEADFACALRQTGGLSCWGANYSGQLGIGPNPELSKMAVPVTSLGTNVIDVSAGGDHTCAVLQDHHVWCWGRNDNGQVGDGTKTERDMPVEVSGVDDAATVTAGHLHTCIVTTTGGVKCWGANVSGQVGDGSTDQRLHPVQVSGLTSGVTQMTAGSNYTCALLADGRVKCWGDNFSGELGDGTNQQRLTPVDVLLLSTGPGPTPTPAPVGLLQGDNDCDGDSDAVDALVSLQKSAGLHPNQKPGCRQLGGAVPAGGNPQLFGDIDCDGDVDAVDALQILRDVAGLPVNQNPGCPAIGDPI